MITKKTPDGLCDQPNWIVWRNEDGRKMPYRIDGKPASSTNPEDWSTHAKAQEALIFSAPAGGRPYTGLGFVFSKDDPFCGVDLDDCRDPETGEIKEWAREIITAAGTYAEVSPSGTGVKLYGMGEMPGGKGRQVAYEDGKVEMYDRGRYFAFTGEEIVYPGYESEADYHSNVNLIQSFIDVWHPELFGQTKEREAGSTEELEVADKTDLTIENYKLVLDTCQDSVEGSRGSDCMIHMLCEIRRMKLNHEQSWELIHWVNDNKCSPPWPPSELERKWEDAKGMTPLEDNSLAFDRCVTGVTHTRPALELIPASALRSMDFHQEFVIDNLLVEGQPFVLGGMSKTLKTGIALDLAFSAAYGGSAFGDDHFVVKNRKNVAFFTGESGGSAIQKRLNVLFESRPVERADEGSDPLLVCLRPPKLHKRDDIEFIRRAIGEHEIGLCLIDPAYLSILGMVDADKTTSVIAMGEVLDKFNSLGSASGCTMGLVHHFTKASRLRKNDWPRLEQMSGSGYAEWARQWCLLGRVQPMVQGKHELKMHVGGSEGHGDNFFVTIDEGYTDHKRGGSWDVTVERADESAIEAFDREDKRAEAAEQRAAEQDTKVLAAVKRIMATGERATNTKIRAEAEVSSKSLPDALDRLVEAGELQRTECAVKGVDRECYVIL